MWFFSHFKLVLSAIFSEVYRDQRDVEFGELVDGISYDYLQNWPLENLGEFNYQFTDVEMSLLENLIENPSLLHSDPVLSESQAAHNTNSQELLDETDQNQIQLLENADFEQETVDDGLSQNIHSDFTESLPFPLDDSLKFTQNTIPERQMLSPISHNFQLSEENLGVDLDSLKERVSQLRIDPSQPIYSEKLNKYQRQKKYKLNVDTSGSAYAGPIIKYPKKSQNISKDILDLEPHAKKELGALFFDALDQNYTPRPFFFFRQEEERQFKTLSHRLTEKANFFKNLAEEEYNDVIEVKSPKLFAFNRIHFNLTLFKWLFLSSEHLHTCIYSNVAVCLFFNIYQVKLLKENDERAKPPAKISKQRPIQSKESKDLSEISGLLANFLENNLFEGETNIYNGKNEQHEDGKHLKNIIKSKKEIEEPNESVHKGALAKKRKIFKISLVEPSERKRLKSDETKSCEKSKVNGKICHETGKSTRKSKQKLTEDKNSAEILQTSTCEQETPKYTILDQEERIYDRPENDTLKEYKETILSYILECISDPVQGNLLFKDFKWLFLIFENFRLLSSWSAENFNEYACPAFNIGFFKYETFSTSKKWKSDPKYASYNEMKLIFIQYKEAGSEKVQKHIRVKDKKFNLLTCMRKGPTQFSHRIFRAVKGKKNRLECIGFSVAHLARVEKTTIDELRSDTEEHVSCAVYEISD